MVCNVRGRSETSNKSDRIDADWLSEQLRLNALKPVHHGSAGVATLKELVRCYANLVDDATRVMLRVKAIYRGRAVATSGKAVYCPSQRKGWLAKLENRGARARAASLLEQLDTLLILRAKARTAMMAEARKQSGWKILRSIPFLGPVRDVRSTDVVREGRSSAPDYRVHLPVADLVAQLDCRGTLGDAREYRYELRYHAVEEQFAGVENIVRVP